MRIDTLMPPHGGNRRGLGTERIGLPMHPQFITCSISDCNAPLVARGFCKSHYERWRTSGTPRAAKPLRRLNRPLAERFWAKVDRMGDCWLWLGAKTQGGYGLIRVGRLIYMAHRIAWDLANSPIPGGARRRDKRGAQGTLVLHRCDTPSCVRPAHLFLGTQIDNMTDAQAKGHHAPMAGELNPNARLLITDIQTIRFLYSQGESPSALAKRFNISKSHVHKICANQSWLTVTKSHEESIV